MTSSIRTLKATLSSNKNASTFKKGAEVCFSDFIEIIMIHVDGVFNGVKYTINNQNCSEQYAKDLIKERSLSNIRKTVTCF